MAEGFPEIFADLLARYAGELELDGQTWYVSCTGSVISIENEDGTQCYEAKVRRSRLITIAGPR